MLFESNASRLTMYLDTKKVLERANIFNRKLRFQVTEKLSIQCQREASNKNIINVKKHKNNIRTLLENKKREELALETVNPW